MMSSGHHFTHEADEGEEDFDESFDLPALQTTAQAVARKRHCCLERSSTSGLAFEGSEVATEDLDSPPDAEDHEERPRKSVTLKTAHVIANHDKRSVRIHKTLTKSNTISGIDLLNKITTQLIINFSASRVTKAIYV